MFLGEVRMGAALASSALEPSASSVVGRRHALWFRVPAPLGLPRERRFLGYTAGSPNQEGAIPLEAITLVCDYADGRVAAEQVTISVRGRRLVVDLCDQHLRELTKNARTPRPGRRRKVGAAPAKRRGRPPGSKNKVASKNGRRKPVRAKTGARKSGARRKHQPQSK